MKTAILKGGKKIVIRKKVPEHLTGNIIGKIVSSFYYIPEDTLISELIDDFLIDDTIPAVGVIDMSGYTKGIICRIELFDMIGKQFGRDLYSNKKVKDIVTSPEIFHYRTDLFTIAEKLSGALNAYKNNYYLLTDRNNNFAGIFSSNDLRIHLSDLMQKDMGLAKEVQANIVKDLFELHNEKISILGSSKMAGEVGGDYYAVKEIKKNQWLLCVCDVSGKGMSAAMVATLLEGTFMFYDFEKGLLNYIMTLNSYMCCYQKKERFVTGTFIMFNENDGTVELFDMGHSYTYLLRKGSFLKPQKNTGSIPLGVSEDIKPASVKFKFKKNDLLIIFTDGIEDQRNPRGEHYDISRVLKNIKKKNNDDLINIQASLFNDVIQFKENQAQLDDMTLLLLRYH